MKPIFINDIDPTMVNIPLKFDFLPFDLIYIAAVIAIIYTIKILLSKIKIKKYKTIKKPTLKDLVSYSIIGLLIGFVLLALSPMNTKLEIRYYGALFASSVIFGMFFLYYLFSARKLDYNKVDSFVIYLVLGIIIGARVVHVVFYDMINVFMDKQSYYLNNPKAILMVWQGGIASHGAAIGLFLGSYIFSRVHKVKFYVITDIVSIPIAFGTMFIRLGNFINSEIVGKITTKISWGVTFLFYDYKNLYNYKTNKFENLPTDLIVRHPSQIYEMIMGLIIFSTLFYLFKKKRKVLADGVILYTLICLYFTLRFIVEFFKEYQAVSPDQSFLTMGQYLSIPLALFGGLMIYYLQKKHSKKT